MVKYRAIVSITFDDEDLDEICNALGIDKDQCDPQELLNGSLDNSDLGTGWIEQFYIDGKPQIIRLSGGMQIEVNEHD